MKLLPARERKSMNECIVTCAGCCAGAGEALPAVEDDRDWHAVSRRLVSTAEQAGAAAPAGLLFGAGHRRPGSRQ